MDPKYDAILVVSFGGPEGPDDVIPFLENVLRGRDVPRARMLEVAEHYQQFGGVSPINSQNRALVAALRGELQRQRVGLPVYWGNRNWHPLLPDTLRGMHRDGVRRALALVTSPYSSYSNCRQYLGNIEQARQEVGADAPEVHKLRGFHNHPDFIQPMTQRVGEALNQLPPARRDAATLLYTAHSIPLTMAAGCQYESQLRDASGLVSSGLNRSDWRLAYQSRSGPPDQPWLEPDVLHVLSEIDRSGGSRDVIVVPIGFMSDHMEVIYDLDTEARQHCEQLGLNMIRAATVGTDPILIRMICKLVLERTAGAPRESLGNQGPWPDLCPSDCCPSGRRP